MSIHNLYHLNTGIWDLSTHELESIIESHSSQVLRVLDMTLDEKRIQTALKQLHPDLFQRLRQSKNHAFHNLEHFLDVHRRLWILLENLLKKSRPLTKNMLLLWEGALIHDDDHAGNTYRQDVIEWAHMSNEEWATYLFEQDIRRLDVLLASHEIIFTRDAVHATSFWQNTLPKNDPRYRPYEAKTLEQKLLVFADVSWPLIDGWEYWVIESIRVIKEVGPSPSVFGEWIESRIHFLTFIEKLYYELESNFKKEFQRKIRKNLDECKANLQCLIDGNLPDEAGKLEVELGLANY